MSKKAVDELLANAAASERLLAPPRAHDSRVVPKMAEAPRSGSAPIPAAPLWRVEDECAFEPTLLQSGPPSAPASSPSPSSRSSTKTEPVGKSLLGALVPSPSPITALLPPPPVERYLMISGPSAGTPARVGQEASRGAASAPHAPQITTLPLAAPQMIPTPVSRRSVPAKRPAHQDPLVIAAVIAGLFSLATIASALTILLR
jgi:hypothetical protein